MGIDRLSLVNEIYGFKVADDVLLETEKRLQDMSHGRAQVLRWSGDVFALLFPTADQAEMADTANSIIKVFYRQPIMTEERPLHIMVSIGGIKLDNPALRANSVATRADMALQEAKQKGRGCFAGYTDKLNEEVNSFKDALAIGDGFSKPSAKAASSWLSKELSIHEPAMFHSMNASCGLGPRGREIFARRGALFLLLRRWV